MQDPRSHHKTIFFHLFLTLTSCMWRVRRALARGFAALSNLLLSRVEVPHAMPRRFRLDQARLGHRLRGWLIDWTLRTGHLVEGFVEGEEAYGVMLTADEETPLWGYQPPKVTYGILELPRPNEPNLMERGLKLYSTIPVERLRVLGHRAVDGRLLVDVVWLSGTMVGCTFTIHSPECFDLDKYSKKPRQADRDEAGQSRLPMQPFRIYKQSRWLTTMALAWLSISAIWVGSWVATHAAQWPQK